MNTTNGLTPQEAQELRGLVERDAEALAVLDSHILPVPCGCGHPRCSVDRASELMKEARAHLAARIAALPRLLAEVERLGAERDSALFMVGDWQHKHAAAEAEVARAQEFIDSLRDDLHNRRVADWYPEGAHNAASAMSEDMRLLGNRCAEFSVNAALAAKPEGAGR